MSKQDIISRTINVATVNRADEGDIYSFVISDETVDRHGTIVLASAWNLDNYNANGVVAYMHDTSNRADPDKIIGKGMARMEGGKLIGDVEFEPIELNTLADKVRRKVDFGSLKATSVGFIPKRAHWGDEERNEDPDVLYFDEVELIEFSIVNIPSNPKALKRSAMLDEFIQGVPKPEARQDNIEDDKGMSDATKVRLVSAENHNKSLENI